MSCWSAKGDVLCPTGINQAAMDQRSGAGSTTQAGRSSQERADDRPLHGRRVRTARVLHRVSVCSAAPMPLRSLCIEEGVSRRLGFPTLDAVV